MRRLIGFVLVMNLVWLLLGCEKTPDPVKRGKYLVTIMGCHDCHTPKVPGPGGVPGPDTKRLLSGHPAELPYPTWGPNDLEKRHALALTTPMLTAWASPWGVSFAANLTQTRRRVLPNGARRTAVGDWG